jgi:DNA polymerase III alpha subunit (gram-positive type)
MTVPSAERIGDEFRRRRAKALVLSGVPLLIGMGLVASRWLAPGYIESRTGLSSTSIFVIASIVSTLGFIVLFAVYRCPKCNKPIWAPDNDSGTVSRTFRMNPKSCPQCGVSYS